MSDLKEDWKNTGKTLGHAMESLAKTVVKSAKHVARKIDDWAEQSEHDKKEQ